MYNDIIVAVVLFLVLLTVLYLAGARIFEYFKVAIDLTLYVALVILFLPILALLYLYIKVLDNFLEKM
ncbi:MAG: hypothetical protein MJZ34_08370 [Paludibacteraceae bacterium]|nr:hypothetical protein [Paludibacteraceae bacterium]